jgi:acyl-CoA synthetase (AMP-forming)/AMP-acid ligase II
MRKDISGWSVRLDDELIERYTKSGDWPNKTMADYAEEVAERAPQRVTHVFGSERLTAPQLLNEARRLASALQKRGLVAGDVVSFQLPNWREAVAIDLACSMLGLVVAPIVPIYRDAEVQFMLKDAGVHAAFFAESYRGVDFASMMDRIRNHLPELKLCIPVRASKEDANSYEALIAEGDDKWQRPNVDPNSVKMILYTSGTTGRPKGVLHTHNTGPLRNQAAVNYWFKGVRDEEGLSTTMLMASPVTHVTGQSAMELPFFSDARTIFMERWDAETAIGLIESERVTWSVGATPFLQELLAEAERQGSRLETLKVFACGGAEVPPQLIRKAYESLDQCKAVRVFGSSECPLITLGFVGQDQEELAATTDGLIVDYDVRVVDDEGNQLLNGQIGEICARGPSMMLGYANPEQTSESFDEDGFFATGDLGYVTVDNAIVITGRKKDLINRGGEKISAKEVEDVLHQIPAIKEAAVVSMPHERMGEAVCAYVILKPGMELDLPTLVEYVRGADMARQKTPERLVVVEDFPRTASGKIRKDKLREDIRQRIAQESQAG